MDKKDDLLSELERVADTQDFSSEPQKGLSKNYIKTTAEQDGLTEDVENQEIKEYMQFLGQKAAPAVVPSEIKEESPKAAPVPVVLDKKQEKLAAKQRKIEEKQQAKEDKIAAIRRAKEEKIAAEQRKKEEKQRIKEEKIAAKKEGRKPEKKVDTPARQRPDAEELRRRVEALLAGRKTPEQRQAEAAQRIVNPERQSTPPLILDPSTRGLRTHMGIIHDTPYVQDRPIQEARRIVEETPVRETASYLSMEQPVQDAVQAEKAEAPEAAATEAMKQEEPKKKPAKEASVVVVEKIDKKQLKKEEKQRKKEEKEAAKKRAADEKKQAIEDKKRAVEDKKRAVEAEKLRVLEEKRLKKEQKNGKSILMPEEMKDDAFYYIAHHPIWIVSTLVLAIANGMLVWIIFQM